MNIRFKKMHPKAKMPEKAHSTDAAFDLVAVSKKWNAGFYEEYDLGIAIELPVGYAAFIYPRSSISKTCLSLCQSVAIIDADFRGSIKLRFRGGAGERYRIGDKVAQMVIMPIPEVEFVESDELSKTERGDGAFGSTGR